MLGEDADLAAIAVPSSIRVAGAITIGTGVCAGVNGLQLLMLTRGAAALNFVGAVALLLAGGCVFAGWGVVRGRFTAALAALGASGFAGLGGMAWIAYALLHGMISLTALALMPLSGVSIFLVALALKDIKKIEEARGRLRAQGLDGGF